MNKNSNYLINLLFIYLAMVLLIGISLYALIKLFGIDSSLSSNLLIWSATLFPSIVIIYTFQSWRNQKASEILAIEAKVLAEMMRDQQELHRKIILSKKYDEDFQEALAAIYDSSKILFRNLSFLESIISNIYKPSDITLFVDTRNLFQRKFYSYVEGVKALNIANTFKNSALNNPEIERIDKSIAQTIDEFSESHYAMYEILIKIMLHSESLSSKH
nr:hypothetical protein [uncultured Acinetobacter sp.]